MNPTSSQPNLAPKTQIYRSNHQISPPSLVQKLPQATGRSFGSPHRRRQNKRLGGKRLELQLAAAPAASQAAAPAIKFPAKVASVLDGSSAWQSSVPTDGVAPTPATTSALQSSTSSRRSTGVLGLEAAKRSWVEIVRGSSEDGDALSARRSMEKRELSVLSEPAMKPSIFGKEQQQLDISDPSSKQVNIISSSPTSIQPRSEQSLIFKKWARGRCYRCLAHDHQVRSCKNFFRCIRCGGTGHRERYCRTLPASPRVLYNEGLQHNQSAQGHQQILQVDPPSQGHQSKVPSSSYASAADLVSKSVVVSWLETLRSDLERMIETQLERMMSPIREELSTIKLWLARVTSHLECRGQERDLSADGSGSNIAELFGPFSPVRFSSSTAMLDSLAAALTSVNPSVCEGANVDMTETNPAAETPQEMPSEQTIEVSTVISTAQIPGDPQKKQLVIQADSQVEDTVIAEDACDVEIISPSRMIVVNPCKEVMTEGPYPTDSSPLGGSVAKRDESQVLSSVRKVASTRCARKLFGKTTLRRSRCPSPRNFLKELGFVKKNGKLDEEKLEAFGDLLKDLLPPDLLLSLMSLKGRAFWKAIAKIFDPFC